MWEEISLWSLTEILIFLLLQWFIDLSDLALLEYMSLMNIVMTQNQT